jgi:hypothetical protein
MVFQADTERENLFELPNGGHLKVPAKAFVDAQGNVLSGTVALRYREMHNEVDIFRTGIPMEYDSGGRQQLETAGMFELRGSQNGQDVFVRSGAQMEVRVASFSADNNFMAYRLDEQARNWKFLQYDQAEPNAEKIKKSKAFQLKNNGYFVLDYTSVLDVEYQGRLYEKPLNHDAVKNKIQRYGLQWLNATGWGHVPDGSNRNFASLMVWKRLDTKPFPQWLHPSKVPHNTRKADEEHLKQLSHNARHEALVTPLGGKNYLMTIHRKAGVYESAVLDAFQFKVELVMSLDELFRFSPEYWQKNRRKAMAQIEEERQRLEKMADAFRTLQVSGFGIFNYDRILKQENVVAAVDFRFDAQWADQSLSVREVWLIPSGSRSVVKWNQQDWASAPLPVDGKAKLLAVLPDSRLAVFTAEQFAAIDFAALSQAKQPRFTFDMHVLPNKIATPEDLVKAIQGG